MSVDKVKHDTDISSWFSKSYNIYFSSQAAAVKRETEREMEEKGRGETDLMRQCDHSLLSDLTNIQANLPSFPLIRAPRLLTKASCFYVSQTRWKIHQRRLLLCR